VPRIPGGPAARAATPRQAARRRPIAVPEAPAGATGLPTARCATGRARIGRSLARGGVASAAQAASRRRRDRWEPSPSDQHRWPVVPARSCRGEGFGSRPQAATRRSRSSVSVLEEGQPRFAQALAAQVHVQSIKVESLASLRVAGKQPCTIRTLSACRVRLLGTTSSPRLPAALGALFLRLRREQQRMALLSARTAEFFSQLRGIRYGRKPVFPANHHPRVGRRSPGASLSAPIMTSATASDTWNTRDRRGDKSKSCAPGTPGPDRLR
jgi:hypothetical protein